MINHDLHIHTPLSDCCNDPAATVENILARAAEAGLGTIGFANHLWDAAVPGASDWYKPQHYDHIAQIRDQIPDETHGLRVLVGCETEFLGGKKIGITPETAARLDYVLAPFTHFHMKGFTVPADLHAPADVAATMTRYCRELLALDMASGLAHPFVPLGFMDHIDEIIAHISEGEWEDLFAEIAERGVSVEVSTVMFPGLGGGEREGFHDATFIRVLSIARRMNCVFHFGSDAHKLEGIGSVIRLEPYARQIGIIPDRLTPLLHQAGD